MRLSLHYARPIFCNCIRGLIESAVLKSSVCTFTVCLIAVRMNEIVQADSSTGTRLPYTSCVEGNIGSGKSTFLELCASQHGMEVLPEPIADWSNVGGVNLLEKMYADPVNGA